MPIQRQLIPLLLLSATTAHAEPPPDEQVPAQLLALRGELLMASRVQAEGEPARYRALCDDEGYPLIGNMLPKTPDDEQGPVESVDPPLQPSALCTLIRAQIRGT